MYNNFEKLFPLKVNICNSRFSNVTLRCIISRNRFKHIVTKIDNRIFIAPFFFMAALFVILKTPETVQIYLNNGIDLKIML